MTGETITIHALQDMDKRLIILTTKNPLWPKMAIPIHEYTSIRDTSAYLRMYVQNLVREGYCSLGDIDISCVPNLYRPYAQLTPDKSPSLTGMSHLSQVGKWPGEPVPEPEFEVNLTECLVGWKAWEVDGRATLGRPDGEIFIRSQRGQVWMPDKAFTAECQGHGHAAPYDGCSCGIYASSAQQGTNGYGDIRGTINGWGRYVRGSAGFRCQFAYPKNFVLRQDQLYLVEALKKYHVPIFVDMPQKMYDPTEEGYDGDWTDQENRDSGAGEVPFAGEADDSREDDED